MITVEAIQRNQEASIQNLEKKIGQLEHVNAISMIVEEEKSAKEEGVIIQVESCTKEKRRLFDGSDEEEVGAAEDSEMKESMATLCKQKVPFPGSLLPKYERDLRDMIMKKDKLREASTFILGEVCSALLTKKSVLPQKLEDFTFLPFHHHKILPYHFLFFYSPFKKFKFPPSFLNFTTVFLLGLFVLLKSR
ncbi:hypothetical protein M9H77_12735 [Catharanthus roseus]|uniref:Uncharacterized protein n=1 Tax=Catharanthus roseus TaxID=4058 RepID=A0ACC0BIF6_CATRO|nr:hypothetical protein M9H77_12735 [Catharanthus roseus]